MRYENTTFLARFFRILKFCWRMRANHVFISTFSPAEFFLTALFLRFLRCRVYAMTESKFDDKQRFLLRELMKTILYTPYHGVLVGGMRSKSYMHFMRIPNKKIFLGCDTVSIDRVRTLANSPPAPNGVSHSERHFTIICRLVQKKNVAMAIAAYDKYRLLAGVLPRDLHICGSGELEDHMRSDVAKRGLSGVIFHGFFLRRVLPGYWRPALPLFSQALRNSGASLSTGRLRWVCRFSVRTTSARATRLSEPA